MRWRQFPLSVAFAMTINKSQGQSLANVDIYFPKPIFSNRQLYVVMFRVKSKGGLKVLIIGSKGKQKKETQMLFSNKYSKTFSRLILHV
ncbi:putative DNA helicase [Arabidopsis thaliana]